MASSMRGNHRNHWGGRLGVWTVAFLLLYLFSAHPLDYVLMRWDGNCWRVLWLWDTVWAPVHFLQNDTPLGPILDRWEALWHWLLWE